MYNTTKGGFQPGQVLNEEPKADGTSVSQPIRQTQCKAQGGQMITVFVKYKDWVEAGHPMLSDSLETFTKIVEVEKLTDLNNMFTDIVDVKVL